MKTSRITPDLEGSCERASRDVPHYQSNAPLGKPPRKRQRGKRKPKPGTTPNIQPLYTFVYEWIELPDGSWFTRTPLCPILVCPTWLPDAQPRKAWRYKFEVDGEEFCHGSSNPRLCRVDAEKHLLWLIRVRAEFPNGR